ncbi:MAG TPA: hypothetical protein VM555_00155 [Tahibacter sp.]|nr:hypothetical protein [Tahibacter sp.]
MTLQLTLINNAGKPGNVFAFQRYGQLQQSIAWLSKYAYPGTQVDFFWDPSSLCFVWSGSGRLGPGVVVDVAQIVPAALSETNQITLSYDAEHRTFFFKDQDAGPPGRLSIRQDNTLPANFASVGVGLANKATLAFDAQPNLMTVIETQSATLYVAFGDYKQGQYIEDVEALGAVEVKFPPNVVAMTATIDAQGQWTVEANVLGKRVEEES